MTPLTRLDNVRVLIYSHDSFGLGHLRRCRAIAHELVGRYKGITVLILSGSPVIGTFEFRARVDFVRIPGIIKLKDGSYTSLGLHIDLDQTLAIRETIIRQTAKAFKPDIFIVDKEPLGLEGEVKGTLEMIQANGGVNVLGEREIIDDPHVLKLEWERKSALPALLHLYDEIWVYGPSGFYDPLRGLGIADEIRDKTYFTGYLNRAQGDEEAPPEYTTPYFLVTPGGGKDGEEMIELVFDSLDRCVNLDMDVLFVLGPFMEEQKRLEFMKRAEKSELYTVLGYHSRIESLIKGCSGMITMGGYNTFCEILSFDKPAIMIPRFEPRTEQLIRARRAAELGWVKMLEPDEFNVDTLAPLISGLRQQSKPSENMPAATLDGMDTVCDRVMSLINARPAAA